MTKADKPLLFRPYGGMGAYLGDSMALVVDVGDYEGLLSHLEKQHPPYGPAFNAQAVTVEPLGFDDRIYWDTWLVKSLDGWGVIGFTNRDPRPDKLTHPLDGKAIARVELATDKLAIRFLDEAGAYITAFVDAGCCSSTWIEHVDLPAGGFPARVLGVADLDLPGSVEAHPEYDCLQVYGLKITTDKGDLVIDYRNSSNGQYGGGLAFDPDPDGPSVSGQRDGNGDYKVVSGDV